jgi:hypothetical protein
MKTFRTLSFGLLILFLASYLNDIDWQYKTINGLLFILGIVSFGVSVLAYSGEDIRSLKEWEKEYDKEIKND